MGNDNDLVTTTDLLWNIFMSLSIASDLHTTYAIPVIPFECFIPVIPVCTFEREK